MTYNKRNISKHKGRFIELTYTTTKNNLKNSLVGEITANTKSHILFRVNKAEHEIILEYNQIIDIQKPKKDE